MHTEKPDSAPMQDASRKEIFIYAIGNVETAFLGGIMAVLFTVCTVALKIDPLLLGLVLGIKTIVDAITDPIMAHITDNTKSRWGRRRPWILIGGVSRQLWLVLMFLLIPVGDMATTNQQLESESREREALREQKAQLARATPPVPPSTVSPAAPVESGPGTMPAEEKALQPPSKPAPSFAEIRKMSFWGKIKRGFSAFNAPENAPQRTLLIYICVGLIVFTTLSTMNYTPYWALGIEMAPSYDGRTRVVAYRSVVDKIAGLVAGWMPLFCFWTIFQTAVDGLFWYSVIAAVIGIPTTILCVMKVRSHTGYQVKTRKPSILQSIKMTVANIHFIKMILLHQIIGSANGVFLQIITFINIYWVFHGSAMMGSRIGGVMHTLHWAIAMVFIPIAAWACGRFQKHVTMRVAVVWVAIGIFLQLFLITPEMPYLQLVIPFFTAVGSTIYYTVLPTMFADITDVDELRTGTRREGMFGAVNAFFGKLNMSTFPIWAGLIMTTAGFEVEKGADQAAGVFERMLFLSSVIPACLVLTTLLVIHRYPWTRERMAEVQQTLKERHAVEMASEAQNKSYDGAS